MTLPHPLVDDGVVTNDPLSRTLTVRPAPNARAYTKVLWREAVRALDGPRIARNPWARGGGQTQVTHGLPTDDHAALEFRFHVGHPVYRKLVSTPALRARIAIDRATGQIISVTFKGR